MCLWKSASVRSNARVQEGFTEAVSRETSRRAVSKASSVHLLGSGQSLVDWWTWSQRVLHGFKMPLLRRWGPSCGNFTCIPAGVSALKHFYLTTLYIGHWSVLVLGLQ